MKIKKGDMVKVTAGKDKGREGKVERVDRKDSTVVLPGINQYKKHRKKTGPDRPGEIITLDRPVRMANIALICPKCKQPTRVGFITANNKKSRICRKCDTIID